MAGRKTKIIGAFLFLLGLGLTVFFVLSTGPGRIWAMLKQAGWWLPVVAVGHVLYIAVEAMAWRTTLRADGARPPFRHVFHYRWVADAMASLVPVAEVAGDVARGFLLARKTDDVSGPGSAAAIIVELTMRTVALVIFIGLGIGLLALRHGQRSLTRTIVAGGILVAVVIFLYFAQRKGLLRTLARKLEQRAQKDHWLRFAGNISGVDEEIGYLYQNQGALVKTAAWHFLGFLVGAVEMWFLLFAISRAVAPLDALSLESVGKAASNAGFFMPAGLGAQEGGYLVGAKLIGLGAAVGVAISLLKRLRDAMVGLPALAVLWFVDIRRREDREALREMVGERPIP